MVADTAQQPIPSAGNPGQPGAMNAPAFSNPVKTQSPHHIKEAVIEKRHCQQQGDEENEKIGSDGRLRTGYHVK